jgi:hypothetical protein
MDGPRVNPTVLTALTAPTAPTVLTVPTVPTVPTCLRCSFPVPSRLSGCKNPCANCGTIYPLGDCSD